MQNSSGILDMVSSSGSDLGARGASQGASSSASDTRFSDALDGHVKSMAQDGTDSPDSTDTQSDKADSAGNSDKVQAQKGQDSTDQSRSGKSDGDGADDKGAADKSDDSKDSQAKQADGKQADTASGKQEDKTDKKQAKDGKDLPVTLPLAANEAKSDPKLKSGGDAVTGKSAKAGDSLEQMIARLLHKGGKGAEAGKGDKAEGKDGGFLKHLRQDMAQLHKPLKALTALQGGEHHGGGGALAGDSGGASAKNLLALTQTMSGGGTAGGSASSGGNGAAASGQSQPSANLSLPQSVNQPGWSRAFNERMLMMVKEGVQHARLELNPKHLGPIEVRMSVHHDQASVAFTAHHAATREALEHAMPRLREMMQQSGLNLAQSQVSDYSSGQSQNQAGHPGGQGRGGAAAGAGAIELGDGEGMHEAPISHVGNGAVDYYA